MNFYQKITEAIANCPQKPAAALRYFKTGPGSYGAHDQFLGISTSKLRKLAASYQDASLQDLSQLLFSPYNDTRELALFILTNQYQRASSSEQEKLYNFYLHHLDRVNNWNLVDVSAHLIIGKHLLPRNRALLTELAQSASIWKRRIAIVATLHFIRNNDLSTTFALASLLEQDKEDLIHKASGWMLREAGKKDLPQLLDYLEQHKYTMPRTSLRYAIERLPKPQRQFFLTSSKQLPPLK